MSAISPSAEVSTIVATAVPAPTGSPSPTLPSTPGPVGRLPLAGTGTGTPPATLYSRFDSEPVAGAEAGPPSWTTPAIGARRVNASTVDFARLYAARAWARWAAPRAPRAEDRLAIPRCTEATSAREVAARVSYWAQAASIWASRPARTPGSAIAVAALRAAANAVAAASSVRRCAAARSRVFNPPPPPPEAEASAALASASCCCVAGESMTATTCPATPLWPGATDRDARVPAVGAVSVATARAVIVADASTTSVTLDRSTVPRLTGAELEVHADAPSNSRTTAAVNAARGARRTRPSWHAR